MRGFLAPYCKSCPDIPEPGRLIIDPFLDTLTLETGEIDVELTKRNGSRKFSHFYRTSFRYWVFT